MNTQTFGVEWIPARAAAEALAVSRTRVYTLVAEGKLTAVKMSGTILINRASVNTRILALSNLKRSK